MGWAITGIGFFLFAWFARQYWFAPHWGNLAVTGAGLLMATSYATDGLTGNATLAIVLSVVVTLGSMVVLRQVRKSFKQKT